MTYQESSSIIAGRRPEAARVAKTVLIVEDNELNMKLFHDLLDAHGYKTLQTRSGMEALKIAREQRPDLILMDIQLPEVSGLEVTKWLKDEEALELLRTERVDVVLLDVMMPAMDGFEVCRRIKGSPRTMHVPVVMVTALDQTSDKVQGLEAGADDFITKPVDDIALITRVKNLARLKTLNDEMMLRMASGAQMGGLPGGITAWSKAESAGRVLLVEDQASVANRVRAVLTKMHEIAAEPDLPA